MSLSILPLLQSKEIVWYLPFHIAIYVVNLWVKYMAKLRRKGSSCTESIVLTCCSSDTSEIKIWCLHWNVMTHSVNKWTYCAFVFCVTEVFHCSVHGMNTRQQNKLHIPLVRLSSIQRGVCYSSAKIFNQLPQNIVNSCNNIHTFKTLMD